MDRTVRRDFSEFAESQVDGLLRLARILTGNDHDAWDLTQESFARIARRWDKIPHAGNLPAYARRVLINAQRNTYRRNTRELPMSSVPDRAVDGQVPSLDLDAWLDEAMRKLSPRQRAAVTLTYLEDLQIDQVASILGCSTSAAKTHLSRGRDALRKSAEANATVSSHHRGDNR
jgi:RNA polymerase sigma-70 factor (sigma-E family)